jgi:O-methyltransferase
MRTTARKLFRAIACRTPLARYILPRYQYQFKPIQLGFVCEMMRRTRGLSGSIVEVGCSVGQTTVFLNRQMDYDRDARRYFGLDTFSGFNPQHVDFEVGVRGKDRSVIDGHGFQINDQRWFDKAMRLNGITRVTSMKLDVTIGDLEPVGPVSFALIDVDLYHPVAAALDKVYSLLQPGGMIIVDDCLHDSVWDGARLAYDEFVRGRGLPTTIAHDKLGVIEKPMDAR